MNPTSVLDSISHLLLRLLTCTLLSFILCHQLLVILAKQLQFHILFLIDAIGGIQALQHVHQERHQVFHHILVIAIDHSLELLIYAPRQLLHLQIERD